MRLRKQRAASAPPAKGTTKPTTPAWQGLLDSEERPSREDFSAGRDVFADSVLEPVEMPRWLRGRRRPRRDRLT